MSLSEVEPRAPADGDPLGDRCGVDRGDRVVDQLHHRAVSLGADVEHELPHCLEERLGALELRGVAADHDRERPVLGLRFRSCYRRVEERDVALAEPVRDRAARARRDRRHVDRKAALAQALGCSVGAEEHRLYLGRVHDHRDRDAGGGRGRRRGVGDHGTVLGRELLGARPGAIPRVHLESGAAQVRGHARSHDPEPQERHLLRPLHVRLLPGSRFATCLRRAGYPPPSAGAPRRSGGSDRVAPGRRRRRPGARAGAVP